MSALWALGAEERTREECASSGFERTTPSTFAQGSVQTSAPTRDTRSALARATAARGPVRPRSVPAPAAAATSHPLVLTYD